MQPRFHPLDDDAGLKVVDPIENRQFVVYTPEAVSPAPADTDEFAFPVSTATAVVASAVTLPHVSQTPVRDPETGDQICEGEAKAGCDLAAGEYLVELISTPLKLYLRVDSELYIGYEDDRTRISFGSPTRVRIGARSHHSSPAETVVVPDDPESVMRAISTFGSALKTTSSERSWPSLRGHPPRLERGDDLSIPDGLEPPDTGVTVTAPPEYAAVYPLAPLAYYLGAEVVPGGPPRLTTASGFTHRLDTARGFEDEVVRVLKQTFLCDCLVRTEGYFPMDLRERRVVESNPEVNLDFAALYGADLGERLEAYLSVPFSSVEEAVPTWNRTVYARPTAAGLELLPYAANDLSVVRARSPARTRSPAGSNAALESFKRSGSGGDSDRRDRPAGIPESGAYVPLPDTDTHETAWVGDGTPVHGAKLLPEAFPREPSTPPEGVIKVSVVCNSEEMLAEWESVSELYGNRDVVAFDVDRRYEVTTDELRELLAAETDLFHFVGHIDGRGFECPDGVLDAREVDETGATAMLLNACRSYDQGRALVDAGARATVVSLGDVGNDGAVEVGETLARLLNYGFTVGSALSIVETHTAIGERYVALGDPDVAVAQCRDGTPYLNEVAGERTDLAAADPDDVVSVTPVGYTNREFPIGSAGSSSVVEDAETTYHLLAGPIGSFEATVERLREIYDDGQTPFLVDGELAWSDTLFDAGG